MNIPSVITVTYGDKEIKMDKSSHIGGDMPAPPAAPVLWGRPQNEAIIKRLFNNSVNMIMGGVFRLYLQIFLNFYYKLLH